MGTAYEDAVRILAKRAYARQAIEARLAARGHPAAAIAEALARLVASGAIDDEAFASEYVATRGRRRGRDRVITELVQRGVDPALAAAAWNSALAHGEHDPADALRRAVGRRLGSTIEKVDRGRLARVYNALLSEGFEPEAIDSALRPYGFEGIDA